MTTAVLWLTGASLSGACTSLPGTFNDDGRETEPGAGAEVGGPVGGPGDSSSVDTTAASASESTTGAGTTSAGSGTDGSSTTGEPPPPNFDPIPSEGCDGKPWEDGHHFSVPVDGQDPRRFDLYVPAGYRGTTPIALVLDFHGQGMSQATEADFSKLRPQRADLRGFAVAIPDGFQESWNAGGCCGAAVADNIDDVGYARAVVQRVAADLCLDERRIYAVGFANGGSMAHRLACEASDVFAAVASVNGPSWVSAAACTPTRSVPVVHFHGTSNPWCAYEGGGMLGCPAVLDTMEDWRDRGGCAVVPVTTFEQHPTTCVTWSECDDFSDITLCTVAGSGHCWPGSLCAFGPNPSAPMATDQILQFFEEHPRP